MSKYSIAPARRLLEIPTVPVNLQVGDRINRAIAAIAIKQLYETTAPKQPQARSTDDITAGFAVDLWAFLHPPRAWSRALVRPWYRDLARRTPVTAGDQHTLAFQFSGHVPRGDFPVD